MRIRIGNQADVEEFTKNLLAWWATHQEKFPHWALAARLAFCLSPNSAACERVFSLMNSIFGPNRASSLADQLQASIMLRFNNNARKNEKDVAL